MSLVKNNLSTVIAVSMLAFLVMPFYNFQASDCLYETRIAHDDGSVSNLDETCYRNFSDAQAAVQEYDATTEKVPFVLRNNEIVYTEYGTVRLTTPTTENILIYSSPSSSSNVGYFNGAYNSDALFLDYCDNNERYKIKINGKVGWINANTGEVKPYANMNADIVDTGSDYIRTFEVLRVRSGPGLEYRQYGCDSGTCAGSAGGYLTRTSEYYEWLNKGDTISADGYEWHKIKYRDKEGYVAQNSNETFLEEYFPSADVERLRTYYEKNSNEEIRIRMNNRIGSNQIVTFGPAPDFMEQNKRYYSFDGIYFYTDFGNLVDDVRNDETSGAINEEPYYNYYLYLPHRSQTNYSSDDINDYFSNRYDGKINRDDHFRIDENGYWETLNTDFPDNRSMLYGEGDNFKNAEEKYGTNAILSLGVAINESGWGRSFFAVRNYNLFGHGAFDHDPGANASSYSSIGAAINDHASRFVRNYLTPTSWVYNGSHLGNKESGMNYRYASDAYWGLKAASHYYFFDRSNGLKDYGTEIVGIKQEGSRYNVRSEPNTNSNTLYQMSNNKHMPVIVLAEVSGEEVYDSDVWYRIQTDININSDREVDRGDGEYDFDSSYAYIHSSAIYLCDDNLERLDEKDSEEKDDNDKDNDEKDENEKDEDEKDEDEKDEDEKDEDEKGENITIDVSEKQILQGEEFDPMKGVTAESSVQGDITDKIEVKENNVDTSEEGLYSVIYFVKGEEEEKTLEVKIEVYNPKLQIPEIFEKSGFVNDEDHLKNIDVGKNLTDFVKKLKEVTDDVEVTMVDSETEEFATGKKILITTPYDKKEYSLVVRGDLNGDGRISIRDLYRLQNHILGRQSYDEIFLLAGDMNSDDDITIRDLYRLQRIILER